MERFNFVERFIFVEGVTFVENIIFCEGGARNKRNTRFIFNELEPKLLEGT